MRDARTVALFDIVNMGREAWTAASSIRGCYTFTLLRSQVDRLFGAGKPTIHDCVRLEAFSRSNLRV